MKQDTRRTYETIVKLNAQEAKDEIRRLESEITKLGEAKKKAFTDKELFRQLSKDLKAAERELRQYNTGVDKTIRTLDNLSTSSVKDLQAAQRSLKKFANDIPRDSPLFAQMNEKLRAVRMEIEQMERLRTFEKMRDEASGLSKSFDQLKAETKFVRETVNGINSASVNQLNAALKVANEHMSEAKQGSAAYTLASERASKLKARIEEIALQQQKANFAINKYDAELEQCSKDAATMRRETELINRTMSRLNTSNIRDIEYSIKIINERLRGMDRGSKEFDQLTERAKRLRTELARIRYESGAQHSWLSRTAGRLNKIQGAAIAAVASITGLTMTVRQCVNEFAEMDDEMVSVQKYTGLSKKEVEELNEDFKKMDTRTSREQLNKLAGEAGRLGISTKKGAKEFVEAADIINVSLGDDLGESAVRNIGKLAMAFGLDDKMGLREAMLATGSIINEVSQNSSSSAGYLIDFTARVAGAGRQLGLTQQQLVGYGAVMDENMLRDEMASTAFSQLLTKMAVNSEKFAKIAGKSVAEFSKLVKEDANEAVLQLAESMRGQDFESMGKKFNDMGLDGTRAVSVLATLTDKVDDIRDRQQLANEAFEQGTSVMDEYNRANESAQAQLEKAKKSFKDMRVELGEKLMPITRSGITAAGLLGKALKVLVEFIIDYKIAIITLTGAIVMWNIVTISVIAKNKVLIPVLKTLKSTFRGLWTTISNNPIGAIITAATLLYAVLADVRRNTEKLSSSQKMLNKINEDTTRRMADEQQRMDNLTKTVKSNASSQTERKNALDEINGKLMEAHLDNISEEDIKTGKAMNTLKKWNKEQFKRIKLLELEDEMRQSIERQHKAEKGDVRISIKDYITNMLSFTGVKSYEEQMKETATRIIEEEKEIQSTIQSEISEIISTNSESLEDRAQRHLDEITKKLKENGKKPPSKSNKEIEKEERERRKREAEALRARREADKKERAAVNAQLADNAHQYAQGIITYREFIQKREEITLQGIDKRKRIWGEGTAEFDNLLRDEEQAMQKHLSAVHKLDIKDIEARRQLTAAKLNAMYYDRNNTLYMNDAALNEALFENDMSALADRIALLEEGSEDWFELRAEMEQREQEHSYQLEREYRQMISQLRQQFGIMDIAEQEAIAIKGLDMLHERGLVKEQEYQEMLRQIRIYYAEQSAEQGSANSKSETTSRNARSAYNTAKNKSLAKIGNKDSYSLGDYLFNDFEMMQSSMEMLEVMYQQDEITHAEYLQAKSLAVSDFCLGLTEKMQAAYNQVSTIMSAMSSYYEAQSKYEQGVITERYDKEIAAAGKNSKRVAQLEEKKDKEIAAVKNKYAKRAADMQMAQALAQTAVNALNAYGSAAAIPIVGPTLAPIAAAMALAAGAIQIAAISKQQEAQQSGYYEGGFTRGNRYRREAGVVHEGEFVANHHAVNNPNLMPLFQFLDRAQQNNTVGSLSAADVSRKLGAAPAAVVAPVVNVTTDNEMLNTSITALNEVIAQLGYVLASGIPAYVTIDGQQGLHKKLEDYKRLINRG